jgi:hypothetical protein
MLKHGLEVYAGNGENAQYAVSWEQLSAWIFKPGPFEISKDILLRLNQ